MESETPDLILSEAVTPSNNATSSGTQPTMTASTAPGDREVVWAHYIPLLLAAGYMECSIYQNYTASEVLVQGLAGVVNQVSYKYQCLGHQRIKTSSLINVIP